MDMLYTLWVESWEIALSALAAAGRTGMLSSDDIAARRAAIAAERTRVTLLIGRGLDGG